ncbi:MAG TPA: hypothetical protein VNI55_13980 [Gaiellaceae bacterium]|nr:hypothetical protein [Gaiellaceae bacterium]
MSESAAASMRRLLGLFRQEGLSFDFAFSTALGRIRIADDEERDLWTALMHDHEGAWEEAYASEDFERVAVCIVPALERLADRERVPQ